MEDFEDLVTHERTYHSFNMLIRWATVLLAAGILWLTLWFAAPVGFIGATAVAVIVLGLGYYFVIRHEAHQPLDPWAMGR
jgi:hypothetical protein